MAKTQRTTRSAGQRHSNSARLRAVPHADRKQSLDFAKYLGLEEDDVESPPADPISNASPDPHSALSPISSVGSSSHTESTTTATTLTAKRKASDASLSDSSAKASRVQVLDTKGDTVMINGEIYDRRRRPGSIPGMQLQMPKGLSENLGAYRSPTSPSVVSTYIDSSANYLKKRRPALSFGSEVSFATAAPGSPNSVVGRLASPTGNLSLASATRPNRQSYNTDIIPLEMQSECGSSIREASPDLRMTGPKSTKKTKKRSSKGASQGTDEPVHIARPPNAWILYRSDQLKIIKNDPVACKKPQADISKLIGALWREENPDVKVWYEQQAEVKKEEHLRLHPDYRFSPQKRKKASAKSVVFTSSGSRSSAAGTAVKTSTLPKNRKELSSIIHSRSTAAKSLSTLTSPISPIGWPVPTAKFFEPSLASTADNTSVTEQQFDDFFQRFLEANAAPAASPAEHIFGLNVPPASSLATSTSNLPEEFWTSLADSIDSSSSQPVPLLDYLNADNFSARSSPDDAPSMSATARSLSAESSWTSEPTAPTSIFDVHDLSWMKNLADESHGLPSADQLPAQDLDFTWNAS